MAQNVASTTEVSLRDAEGIEPSLSVHSASLHARLSIARPLDLFIKLSLSPIALIWLIWQKSKKLRHFS